VGGKPVVGSEEEGIVRYVEDSGGRGEAGAGVGNESALRELDADSLGGDGQGNEGLQKGRERAEVAESERFQTEWGKRGDGSNMQTTEAGKNGEETRHREQKVIRVERQGGDMR
jgi:hypothetical protein